MSRIGKLPVTVPQGVTPDLKGQTLTLKGKLGALSMQIHPEIAAKLDGGKITLMPRSQSKRARMLWGTNRALVANMLEGVTKGFSVDMEINGVGYRAALEGKSGLSLQLGFSHEVKYPIPEGITIKVGEKQTTLSISGADKRVVGQVAAEIRALRKPEPYKGKGIKFAAEHIRRKEGKKK
jgi:large subunit ribosomal protein L6